MDVMDVSCGIDVMIIITDTIIEVYTKRSE